MHKPLFVALAVCAALLLAQAHVVHLRLNPLSTVANTVGQVVASVMSPRKASASPESFSLENAFEAYDDVKEPWKKCALDEFDAVVKGNAALKAAMDKFACAYRNNAANCAATPIMLANTAKFYNAANGAHQKKALAEFTQAVNKLPQWADFVAKFRKEKPCAATANAGVGAAASATASSAVASPTTPGAPATPAAPTTPNAGGGKFMKGPFICQYLNQNQPGVTCQNTAIAMALQMSGAKTTPDEIYAFAGGNNLGKSPGGAAEIFDHFAKKSGIPHRMKAHAGDMSVSAGIKAIQAALASGHPVYVNTMICGGHVVLLTGFDGTKYQVHDPAGKWNEKFGQCYGDSGSTRCSDPSVRKPQFYSKKALELAISAVSSESDLQPILWAEVTGPAAPFDGAASTAPTPTSATPTAPGAPASPGVGAGVAANVAGASGDIPALINCIKNMGGGRACFRLHAPSLQPKTEQCKTATNGAEPCKAELQWLEQLQGGNAATSSTPGAPAATTPGATVQQGTSGAILDQLKSASSPLSKAIGFAEGNLDVKGNKQKAYFGHTDPGNGKHNIGTFSFQHSASSPEDADQQQLKKFQSIYDSYTKAAQAGGYDPNNVLLATAFFDLFVQSELAAMDTGGYLDQLRKKQLPAITPDAIITLRVNTYKDPKTGKLDAPGFGNSESALRADQKRRVDALVESLKASGALK